jgi:hypothetical protein
MAATPPAEVEDEDLRRSTVRMRLTVGDHTATAALLDNETAHDFASLLPLTLAMHDLFGREKPGQLPRALASGGLPQSTYQVGDLGYWSPSRDLAIFYHHDGQRIPNPGIVIIGRIDSGLDVIASAGGAFHLTIELID